MINLLLELVRTLDAQKVDRLWPLGADEVAMQKDVWHDGLIGAVPLAPQWRDHAALPARRESHHLSICEVHLEHTGTRHQAPRL